MQKNQRQLTEIQTGHLVLEGLQGIRAFARTPDESLLCPARFDTCGQWHRVVTIDGKQVVLQLAPSGTLSWSSSDLLEEHLIRQQAARLFVPLPFPREAAAHLPADLAASFLQMSPYLHLASASPGEALIKAILRQVIAATQAKKLLHRFVLEFGPAVEREGRRSSGFPSLEEIAALSPERLVACGLGYKARVLPRVAHDLLDAHLEEQIWELPVAEAIERLEGLKGVGPWTAHVTICDVRGDWSVYPCEDLAVRRWASRLWPAGAWPREEHAFRSAWQEANGPFTGIVTCYLLALATTLSQGMGQEEAPTHTPSRSVPVPSV